MNANELLTRDELRKCIGVQVLMRRVSEEIRSYQASAKTNPSAAAQAMFTSKIEALNIRYNELAEREAEFVRIASERYNANNS